MKLAYDFVKEQIMQQKELKKFHKIFFSVTKCVYGKFTAFCSTGIFGVDVGAHTSVLCMKYYKKFNSGIVYMPPNRGNFFVCLLNKGVGFAKEKKSKKEHENQLG